MLATLGPERPNEFRLLHDLEWKVAPIVYKKEPGAIFEQYSYVVLPQTWSKDDAL